jgi:hypothetical protein
VPHIWPSVGQMWEETNARATVFIASQNRSEVEIAIRANVFDRPTELHAAFPSKKPAPNPHYTAQRIDKKCIRYQ